MPDADAAEAVGEAEAAAARAADGDAALHGEAALQGGAGGQQGVEAGVDALADGGLAGHDLCGGSGFRLGLVVEF